MKHKTIIFIFILFFVALVSARPTYLQNQFTNGLSVENITYNSPSSIVRFIEIPIATNFTEASILLKGFDANTSFFVDNFTRPDSNDIGMDWIEVEVDPIFARLRGNEAVLYEAIGSSAVMYRELSNWSYTNFEYYVQYNLTTDGSIIHTQMFYNGSGVRVDQNKPGLSVEVRGPSAGQDVRIHLNDTLLHDQDYGGWVANNNYTLKVRYNGTTIKVKHWLSTSSEPATYDFMYNVTLTSLNFTGDKFMITPSGSTSYNLIINYVNLTFFPNITSPYLEVGDPDGIYEWNHTGILYKSKGNFSSKLNELLPSCNCNNCTIDSSTCTIPLSFYSNSGGIIEASNISINYSYTFELNNCTRGMETLNLSSYNITDNSSLAVDMGAYFNYWITDKVNGKMAFNYTLKKNDTRSERVCIYPNGTSVYTDFHIEYDYDSVKFSYFGNDINLTNITRYVNLYVTDGTTLVLFNVKDITGSDLEDVYITIDKYEVGTNSYTTVEVLKTDSQGNAVGNLVLNTEWYRITLTYDGVVRLVDGPTRIISTTNNYAIDITGDDYFDGYDDYKGIIYNLSFNNATKNFKLIYNDPNMIISTICLKVTQWNVSGNVVIGNTCQSSYSGTILISVGTDVTDKTFLATAYVKLINGDEYVLDVLEKSFQTEWKFYDNDGDHYGVYVSFLFVLVLVMIGIWNPIISVIMLIVGVAVMKMLGLYYISWPVFLVFSLLGGIVIYKVNSAK